MSGLDVAADVRTDRQKGFLQLRRFWGVLSPTFIQQVEQTWQNLKETHFIVFYESKFDKDFAQLILQKAEDYYRKIGRQIGFTRYSEFWTWEERVKIILFAQQSSFLENTGQPQWSKGYVHRERRFFKTRMIVTFRQEQDFLDASLPHEISHLILHDFIPQEEAIPLWFDEGIAQLQEKYKSQIANQMMRLLVKRGQYIRFPDLHNWDPQNEDDPQKIKIFYSQSLSAIEFLIKTYGSEALGKFCRNLRDGKTFEQALRSAYPTQLETLFDLEQKWVRYMRQQ